MFTNGTPLSQLLLGQTLLVSRLLSGVFCGSHCLLGNRLHLLGLFLNRVLRLLHHFIARVTKELILLLGFRNGEADGCTDRDRGDAHCEWVCLEGLLECTLRTLRPVLRGIGKLPGGILNLACYLSRGVLNLARDVARLVLSLSREATRLCPERRRSGRRGVNRSIAHTSRSRTVRSGQDCNRADSSCTAQNSWCCMCSRCSVCGRS